MTDVEAPAALYERRGNVALITINRPDARNAVNGAVSTAVGDALQQAQDDADVWAVVITGAGDKSFCAGADLKAISRRENLFHPQHPEWGFAGYVRHFIDKPTIAAVNGTAFGGGTELALASDLVVAQESAKFGLPEVKRGLIAAAGGVFRIVEQLPRKVAMQLLFTGEPITAAEALEWGLINQVVPDGTVVEAALALAERITVNAPLAVQASKRVAAGVDDGTITADEARLVAHHARDRRADEVGGRQGRAPGVRREASAGLEGALNRSRLAGRDLFCPEHAFHERRIAVGPRRQGFPIAHRENLDVLTCFSVDRRFAQYDDGVAVGEEAVRFHHGCLLAESHQQLADLAFAMISAADRAAARLSPLDVVVVEAQHRIQIAAAEGFVALLDHVDVPLGLFRHASAPFAFGYRCSMRRDIRAASK